MEVPHQNGHSGARRLLFEKELTPSDVSKSLVIPKKFAEKYFPQTEVEVILSFYDVDNLLWKFGYCKRKASKSSVFTRGWIQFVKSKNLMAKDKVCFYYNEDSSSFEIETGLPTSNIGALGMGTQGTYVESKKDEEDQKMQTTKGFTLFGVHIIPS
ncbi:AP2/ERF and B3 domain-containing transcription factor like protein [Tanacetum coccineum]